MTSKYKGEDLMENTTSTTSNCTSIEQLQLLPSRFEGRLIALIGINLLTSLVSIITLGFAYPAMYCFKKRWIYRNTIINGLQLKFTGTGAQLFGKYILWTFLTIITIGIFSLWLPIKYQQWEVKHVEVQRFMPE